MLKKARKEWLILRAAVLVLVLAMGCARQPSPSPDATVSAGLSDSQTAAVGPGAAQTQSPLGQGSAAALFTPTREGPPASPTASSSPAPSDTATLAPTQTWTPTPSPTPVVRFAVIGDYGEYNASQTALAEMIDSWGVDFIATVGDNNYPNGEAETIDINIGQNFHEYIYNYQGDYGEGSDVPRFFPALGNHDTYTDLGQPYFDYFTLPGNERYYTFTWGVVEGFIMNSDPTEPDGVGRSSAQAQWLQAALDASDATWKLVFVHAAPYTSGSYQGPTDWSQWPYEEWGADAVLAGHEHVYERLQIGGIPYFITGMGGQSRYNFGDPIPGSMVRFNDDFGAMLVEARPESITYQFYTISGQLVDELILSR